MDTQAKKKTSDVKLMVLVLSICFVLVVMTIIGAVAAIVGIVMTSYSNIPMFESVSEMSGAEKNAISHRGKAIEMLAKTLKNESMR